MEGQPITTTSEDPVVLTAERVGTVGLIAALVLVAAVAAVAVSRWLWRWGRGPRA